MVGWRTLKAALDLGADSVDLTCNACLHRRRFAPRAALKLFGPETLITDIAKRVRCRCGAKHATAIAAWPRRSRGGGDPQMIVPKEWGRLP